MKSTSRFTRRTALRRVGAAAAVGGFAGFSGCTNSGGGDGEGSSGSIKVGFLYPTSGPYLALDEYQVGRTEVAIDQVDSEVDVELENVGIFDTKLDPQEGLRRAKELTD